MDQAEFKPRAHGGNLRKGRVSHPEQIYVLTSVTFNRKPLFGDFNLGRIVVREFMNCQRNGLIEIFAYVVMPDHFHCLICLKKATLPEVMRQVKMKSAQQINAARLHTGRVWQSGYHDHALRNEVDLLGVARYIVANPLRAGLVQRLGDYPLWHAVWV